MKSILLPFFLIFGKILFGQTSCIDELFYINFDHTSCISRLTIDNSLPNNIWQIGRSQKPMQDSTACMTKTIVTDTINPYPVNNHSSFTIVSLATHGAVWGFRTFGASYYVQCDSLNDFGKIELSLDKGVNWIDILNDTTYANHFNWFSTKPVLTGRSFTCNTFYVDLADLTSIHNFQVGDTLLFRFSFFSDGIFDNQTGLIFDNFSIYDFVQGIAETHFQSIRSKVYPNPSSRFFTIDFDNPERLPFLLAVYDIKSNQIIAREEIRNNRISLDMQDYKPGMYVYKITNWEHKKRTWGRFNYTGIE